LFSTARLFMIFGVGVHAVRTQAPAQPEQPSFRMFLPLGLPVAVLAGMAAFALLTPFRPHPGPPPGKPGALVWGDAIFANTAELKAWLKLHGDPSYSVWLGRHPAAARLVKTEKAAAPAAVAHQARPATAAPTTAAAPKTAAPRAAAKTAAPTPQSAEARAAPATAKGGSDRTLTIVFALLAVLAFGATVAPMRLVRHDGRPIMTEETRWLVAAGGIGVLAGLAVALFIG
jgi:hypothetical protein